MYNENFNGLKWFIGFVVMMGIFFMVATYINGCVRQQVDIRITDDSVLIDSSDASEGIKLELKNPKDK